MLLVITSNIFISHKYKYSLYGLRLKLNLNTK